MAAPGTSVAAPGEETRDQAVQRSQRLLQPLPSTLQLQEHWFSSRNEQLSWFLFYFHSEIKFYLKYRYLPIMANGKMVLSGFCIVSSFLGLLFCPLELFLCGQSSSQFRDEVNLHIALDLHRRGAFAKQAGLPPALLSAPTLHFVAAGFPRQSYRSSFCITDFKYGASPDIYD